jgi:hypothetical protein
MGEHRRASRHGKAPPTFLKAASENSSRIVTTPE